MSGFVERTGLVSLWFELQYRHVHTDGKSKSTIDHILLSPRLLPLVEDCGVVERGDNLSRHCPIWVKLKLGALPVRPSTRTWVPKKPCWSKASTDELDEYTDNLQSKLLALQVPASVWCADPHCSDNGHCHERDKLVLDMLDCMTESIQISAIAEGGPRSRVCAR